MEVRIVKVGTANQPYRYISLLPAPRIKIPNYGLQKMIAGFAMGLMIGMIIAAGFFFFKNLEGPLVYTLLCLGPLGIGISLGWATSVSVGR